MQILGGEKKSFQRLNFTNNTEENEITNFFFAKFAYKYDITLVIGQQKN